MISQPVFLMENIDKILATQARLSEEDIRSIFRPIATGEDAHGDFLTHFAKALAYADPANFGLLRTIAVALIVKYRLAPATEESAFPG